MQLGRLFEMVYLLVDRRSMTAVELAEHFEVSARTIYRDVEVLSQAGIPVYAERGKGGGIRLTENFILSRAVFSEEERRGLLSALKGMEALGAGGVAPALQKLTALFGGEQEDWIEVDFSAWSEESTLGGRFQLLKEAIFARRLVSFRYSGARGETRKRLVEPMKLVFRGYDWYLLAWCRWREDFRYFKLSRMDGLSREEEVFSRRPPPAPLEAPGGRRRFGAPMVGLTVDISAPMAFRVRDEFPPERREELPGGGFRVRAHLPEDEWLYEYLMTYGGNLRVVEPGRVREELARRHKLGLEANAADSATARRCAEHKTGLYKEDQHHEGNL